MKKYFYIFTLFFLQAIIAACTDSEIYDSPDNGTASSIKIILNIPVDNGKTRGLIYGPDEDPIDGESVIKDVHALAFDKSSGKYLGKLQSYMSDGSLISKIEVNEIGLNELTIVVLTNLGSLENGNELISQINALAKDKITKTEVLKSLKYTFTSQWVLTDRPLPMWGETDVTPIKESTAIETINLYRSISKINVVVNNGNGRTDENGIEVFKLKSVRVYYARTSGLTGSLHAPVVNEEGGSNTIIHPSIPEGVDYFPRHDKEQENNLLFEEKTEGGSYAIENKIYVPESDQTNTEEPMCLVVGGYYMGSTQETYYRVDFKQGNKGTEFYNAIRNHIYTFNINNVTRPGTDEPDPALDHVVVGMDVSIKDWTTEWMRGIGGQYTLEVEAGGLFLESTNTRGNELWVKSTHNNGWNISDQSGDWFTVVPKTDKSGVILTANRENFGGQRRGSFVITSGNLSKVIMVRQKGKGTANCYVVSDNGEHILQDLIVTVKGNGEDGLIADGHPLADQEPNLAPDDVKIIWQTAKGLVTLKTDAQGKAIINENGIVQFQIDLTKKNADIAKSNYPNQQGGNALIGAFKNGVIIWTWHLWVCPDLDANKNGYVDDNELSNCTQTWNTGYGYGYDFLDRYLGALTNKPGLTSLGLLYQWGRKDPFIGAARISETLSGNRMDTDNLSGYGWKNSSSNMSIEESVKNPTTLINGTITGADYSFLWGTDKGFTTVRDAGNKTIYDPCPIGYRVPPVSSIVFTNGSSSSEDTNYDRNVTWWPNAQSSTYVAPGNTDSYGFWLNCNSASSKPSGVNSWSSYGNKKNNVSVTNAAWLPLAGVYDGDINTLATVDGGNSVVVNSIIWTNSSIQVGNSVRPGALFLHGREKNSSANGRHLHRLIENSNDLYAKPTHAGSVRCIKDTKASIQNAIQVPEEITLNYANGSYVDAILTSITESWEVIDPGAMWFVMTPDQGIAGSQQSIRFTATSENTGTTTRSAILKIKFSDGSIRDIKVTQSSSSSTTNLTFKYNEGGSYYRKSVNIGTSNFTWECTPSSSGLKIDKSGKNLRIYLLNDNYTSQEYRWTITVKNSEGKIIYYINVTQSRYF